METLQTLPQLARDYQAAQVAAIEVAVAEVLARWLKMGVSFDTGWALIGPTVAAVVADAQRGIVVRADEFIPAFLEATGQVAPDPPPPSSNVAQLIGLTGAGLAVRQALGVATIRAKQAVLAGATPQQALGVAGGWLVRATRTTLADTARSAEGLGRYTRNVGYIRMVQGGACGRCVVLAGRWYRTDAGFPRHDNCRCFGVPASKASAGDWHTNPDVYFHSLNEAQQIKLMGGVANAQAVRDGADIGRIVNAYRKAGGVYTAQQLPGERIRATTVGFRGQPSKQLRLMPETIARLATSYDERMAMLRKYGWIF